MANTGVLDLLKFPLHERSESLRETWPHPLDASLTGHDGVSWTVEEKAAIDIAVLVIRAINAHCDPLDPDLQLDDSTLGERRKTEEKTYLLHYSWYSTPGEVDEAVLNIQKHICRKVLRGKVKITFEGLMECGVLAATFWSRPELLAWSLMENVRLEGVQGWRWTKSKISCIPDRKGQSVVEQSAILEQLARKSLLKWNWDGETQLADFLTSTVKLEWSASDGKMHHRGIQAWPRCLRVRFDPRGRDDSPRFSDLARIIVNDPMQQKAVNYRLLATVKLGGEGGRDFVRVYDSDCRDARPMATQVQSLPYVNNEWKLGEPGSRYMLYYLSCGPELALDLDPKEVVLRSWRHIELVKQLKEARASIEAGLPEHRPYGRITVREPDGPGKS